MSDQTMASMTNETAKRYEAFVSVVVPVANAGAAVEALVLRLNSVMQAAFRSYEIVLVDNGSADDTVARIQAMQATIPNLQLYVLNRRNDFGVAIIAGLDNSIGDFVFTLNPETDAPELLPEMFALMLRGSEVICGTLREQMEQPLYRWGNRQYARLLQSTVGVRVPAGMTDLRLYSRGVLSYINRNSDRHLLLKMLPFMATGKIAVFPYNSLTGRAASHRRGLFMTALSSITVLLSSSVAPLRLLTLLTVAVSLLSLAYAVYVVAVALLKRNIVEGWVSIALPMAVIFFFISTILGVLSEYIFRVVQHTRNAPVYLISGESTSATSELNARLNVVQRDGEFAARPVNRDRE
jgi:glycosyltransferase involved in cell wall biosynthesis